MKTLQQLSDKLDITNCQTSQNAICALIEQESRIKDAQLRDMQTFHAEKDLYERRVQALLSEKHHLQE